jgi:RNA 3'-terminal phosphate cyclase (ATP)
MTTMIVLDGSQGEGGGQILRSALALSLCTGIPFRIDNIRAGRKKPGLMRQHLTAAMAAAEIGHAEIAGATVGSRSLYFKPGNVHGGDYTFSVGTAGSATLVLQTVLPALLTTEVPSTIVFEGGTHNPAAPPFDFLEKSFLPLLATMGPRCTAKLERPGFYPAGGGRMRVTLEPAPLLPLSLLHRGTLRSRRVRAVHANLPRLIAERELARLVRRLSWESTAYAIEEWKSSVGPGNVVLIEVASEAVTEVFTGFGEKAVRAETVADRAADEVLAYLASDVPVGIHLADQLVLLLALAGAGSFRTLAPSQHTKTQFEVIKRFLDREPTVVEEGAGVCRITVK